MVETGYSSSYIHHYKLTKVVLFNLWTHKINICKFCTFVRAQIENLNVRVRRLPYSISYKCLIGSQNDFCSFRRMIWLLTLCFKLPSFLKFIFAVFLYFCIYIYTRHFRKLFASDLTLWVFLFFSIDTIIQTRCMWFEKYWTCLPCGISPRFLTSEN